MEDRPFAGRVPVRLPARRTVATRSGPKEVPLSAEAKQWWATVRQMPHCCLWSRSDWVFAVETALVADLGARGVLGASTELRQRERVIGMTADSRRDLRIRYVPTIGEPISERDAAISDLAEYRRRIIDEQ